MKKIIEVAKKLGLKEEDIELYGDYKAKLKLSPKKEKGKLILVSAINPTTSGEGKTTLSIGLSDALNSLGYNSVLALREPSLGPVFGMKGGATGGGKSVILPSDDINLHFTGDFHAITSANNLLCAMVDNSLFQGNPLNIAPERIVISRAMDMNDRSLREIEISLSGLKNEVPRRDSFVITSACEIMALLCLASDFDDLKRRLGSILVAYNYAGDPIYAKDLKADEAMAILLKDAIYPNLVQTGEGNPAIVHGGPFANIAHGCNSLIATKLALSLGDYCVTEAGFGGDLGGEKFLDIKCRCGNISPDVVVIVATIKALRLHSPSENLSEGFLNLKRHVENFKNVFNQRVIVALNLFADDEEEDIKKVIVLCNEIGTDCITCSPYIEGSPSCVNLAKKVILLCEGEKPLLTHPYNLNDTLENKIFKLASKIYGARTIEYSPLAKDKLKLYSSLTLPIVVAKTQYSFSDNPSLLGAPKDFTLHVDDIELKNGAKFLVIKTGKIFLMPGLNKEPNATKMRIDSNRNIFNLQ